MKLKYSSVLMWLLILSPIVDNVNGYLLLTGKNASVSVLFKTVIFLFCIYIVFRFMTNRKMIGIICISFIFIIQFIIWGTSDIGGFSYNISVLIKLLTPIVIVTAMKMLMTHDETVPLCIEKISTFYCWFFPISLIIPMLFNVSFNTYNSGVGNKGIYFAGNEISSIMIIILALEFERFRKDKSKKNLINVALGIISIITIGTKAGFISLIIIIVSVLYLENVTKKKLLSVCLIVPVVALVMWYVINNIDLLRQIVNAWQWKYSNLSNGIINFLLSGRNFKINRAIGLVYNENSIWKMIVGVSPDIVVNKMDVLVEMDIFDLMLWFGIIVSFIIIAIYVKYIKMAIYSKKMLYIIGIALIYGASFVAGHVIFAPMVSIVLALLWMKIELELNRID